MKPELGAEEIEQLARIAKGNGAGPAPASPFALTDLGNCERLVAAHGQDIRYVPGLGWHVWDGARWRQDDTGEVQRRAKQSARTILRDAANCDSDEVRKALTNWARKSEGERYLRAAVTLASSESAVVVRAAELDSDPLLLNVANGTVDLRTGELRGHARADLITTLTEIALDSDATCPRWLQFLREVFAKDEELTEPDEDLIKFVQRFVGYCLTGDTREEMLAVFHGAGSNGKSTLLAVLKRMLGEQGVTASFETFMRARGDRGPRNDLARLHRARLVTAAESGEGRRLDEATLKEITGRDTVAARFLHQEHFEFVPQFKLVFVTNHRPKIDGADDAIWRRLRLVPFERSFEGGEDKQLGDRLGEELAGILAWAIRGCLDWQEHGLGESEAIADATSEYRQDEDLLGAFLDDCCVLSGEIEPTRLREAYEDYCREIGEEPLAPNSLGKALSRRGIKKIKRARVYRGVRLR